MTAALPYWPAAMKRGTAARYCELSPAEFEREIASGRLPGPFRLGSSEHWSRAGLDEALERITNGGANDWRRKLGLYDAA